MRKELLLNIAISLFLVAALCLLAVCIFTKREIDYVYFIALICTLIGNVLIYIKGSLKKKGKI